MANLTQLNTEQDASLAQPSAFHDETVAVLNELRPALAKIVDELRPPVARVVDLRHRLNLGQQICWGIFNAATTPDIHQLPALLPGTRGMERFFDACARNGVPMEAIEHARASFKRFEGSVARHARSRDAFAAMAAQNSNGGSSGSTVKARQKRAMFRAASLLWGREARVSYSLMVNRVNLKASPPQRDFAFIKGLVGLHRTASDVPLHVGATMRRTLSGAPEATPIQPLDEREADGDSVGLLRDFCSQPLPRFRVTQTGPGLIRHELVSGDIGAAAEVTYFTGHVGRGIPVHEDDDGVAFRRQMLLPVEVAFLDFLMHESAWPSDTPPEVKVYNSLETGNQEPPESDVLPVTEKAVFVGRGVEPGRTPLVPKYVDMLNFALDRLGWKPEEFRLFRCRVDHPIIQSFIRLKFVQPGRSKSR